MSLFSLFSGARTTPAPAQPKPASLAEMDVANAVIELIYAGQDLSKHLIFPADSGRECICGAVLDSYHSTPEHHRLCPVQRHAAAVERVRKVVL